MKHTLPLQLKYWLFVCLLMVALLPAKAQYVTIPDTAFVSWLKGNGFSQCFNGNQMDTTCSAVNDSMSIACNHLAIRDLTGIQYFSNLIYLDCSNDSIYNIPSLPASLGTFYCSNNNLSVLPSLANTHVSYLDCGYNQLSQLPAGVTGVEELWCDNNKLTSLPRLDNLIELYCSNNLLTKLPELGFFLDGDLTCSNNLLTSLPDLSSSSLYSLYCSNNMLDSLPVLPPQLRILFCANNRLTLLPPLTNYAFQLNCSGNRLTSLPYLSDSYDYIPWLLDCSNNQLTTLPQLPTQLDELDCSRNPLDSIPYWGERLNTLRCGHTLISSLPPLQYLVLVDCDSDVNLYCLPQLYRIDSLIFTGSPISCIPDYGSVTGSNPPLTSLPFCSIFSTSGCEGFWNISGTTYDDVDSNCIIDSGDIKLYGVKVLLDSGGVIQQQTYSGWYGHGDYSFLTNLGNYGVSVDTTGLPFTVFCPDSNHLIAQLDLYDSVSYYHDFALRCPVKGFDAGVRDIWTGHFHNLPGGTIRLYIDAGDISQFYGAHCATGFGGQLQLVLNGPVSYYAPVQGALTPLVNGDTLTYNISDWGAIDNFSAFDVILSASPSAPLGTVVCVTAIVTPLSGDNNLANNTLTYCFALVNSHDPNEKEVYPTSIDSANQWLTYTVRFQNTGTAPAVNIIVRDTLNPNLDLASFQLLAYSAKNLTQVFGNVVVFNFPNINLADSTTSDSLSRGFVQYRVKTISNLQQDAVITNTASIYFDLNTPVQTNTVTDTVASPQSCTPNGSSLSQSICSGDTFYIGNKAYYAGGTYADTLQNTGGCDSIVALTLTVNPLPVVTLSWDSMVALNLFHPNPARGDTDICSFLPKLVPLAGGLPPGGIYNGYEVVNDSLSLINGIDPINPDIITYTFTDNNGCIGKAIDSVELVLCAGIQSISGNNAISIYPNPANNLLYIKTEGLHAESILIYDVDGQVVSKQAFAPEIDIHNLTPGVYLLEVISIEGTMRKRWVKM